MPLRPRLGSHRAGGHADKDGDEPIMAARSFTVDAKWRAGACHYPRKQIVRAKDSQIIDWCVIIMYGIKVEMQNEMAAPSEDRMLVSGVLTLRVIPILCDLKTRKGDRKNDTGA